MDTTTRPPAQRPTPAAITPLLRSVVLCDLVDSTALAERIGDVRIAELMQAHDRLLLSLLVDHQGQLVDRADGVLALFERPVNATAFALAYQRGLRDLGQQLGQPLQARVGIHVGDVMIWTNSPADVLAGAKPVEVEGLAKPVAARLMGLALPGQILMSGMAQNLAQRAQGELGHIAPKLLWRLHGRYRFKGVPAPMLVHEVGELGIAPLRPPVSTEKAWRELPLWRKPPVLALEAVLAVSLAVGGVWSMLKSPPAIAFNERDWVVVADFNNLTGETLYDEALDTALRVGLEQSRYVNVMSDLQVEQALQRMQREGQRVDRQVGSELAQREGAKAVLLPTLALVGGRPRVTLEVVDPSSGVTVYTQMADARDGLNVLPVLQAGLDGLRAALGESLVDIEKSSTSLERATTSSLEALRAFALGQQAYADGDVSVATAHYETALRLDPEFALAMIGLGRVKSIQKQSAEAAALVERASELGERLTTRERLYLEAVRSLVEWKPDYPARWQAVVDLYPDFHAASLSCGTARLLQNRFRDAMNCLRSALEPISALRARGLQSQGIAQLGLGDINAAIQSFEAGQAMGYRGAGLFESSAAALAGQYETAVEILEQARARPESEVVLIDIQRAAISLDRGGAEDPLNTGICDLSTGLDPSSEAWKCAAFLAFDWSSANQAALGERIEAVWSSGKADLSEVDAWGKDLIAISMLYAAQYAVQLGWQDRAQEVLDELVEIVERSPHSAARQLAALTAARLDLRSGRAEAALERLLPLLDGGELILTRAVLAECYERLGRNQDAIEQLDWLRAARARGYVEWSGYYSVLRIENAVRANSADLAAAELLVASGDLRAAKDRLARLHETWPALPRLAALQPRLSQAQAGANRVKP